MILPFDTPVLAATSWSHAASSLVRRTVIVGLMQRGVLSRSLVGEQSSEVHLARADPRHFDPALRLSVENQIAADRKDPDLRCEVRPKASQAGQRGQPLALTPDPVDQTVGGPWLLFRDVQPDLGEVGLCRTQEARSPLQSRFLSPARRRRPSALMAARVLRSKGRDSPRSRALMPTLSSRRSRSISTRRKCSRSSRRRRASRTTSLAEPYRPLATLRLTSRSSSGVSDTFMTTSG